MCALDFHPNKRQTLCAHPPPDPVRDPSWFQRETRVMRHSPWVGRMPKISSTCVWILLFAPLLCTPIRASSMSYASFTYKQMKSRLHKGHSAINFSYIISPLDNTTGHIAHTRLLKDAFVFVCMDDTLQMNYFICDEDMTLRRCLWASNSRIYRNFVAKGLLTWMYTNEFGCLLGIKNSEDRCTFLCALEDIWGLWDI